MGPPLFQPQHSLQEAVQGVQSWGAQGREGGAMGRSFLLTPSWPKERAGPCHSPCPAVTIVAYVVLKTYARILVPPWQGEKKRQLRVAVRNVSSSLFTPEKSHTGDGARFSCSSRLSLCSGH